MFGESISWILSILQPEAVEVRVSRLCVESCPATRDSDYDFSFDVERKTHREEGGERIKSVIRVYSLCLYGANGKALNLLTHTQKERERAVMNSQGSLLLLLFTFRLLIGQDL